MSWLDPALIASRLAATSARVAFDAARANSGGALPLSSTRLRDPGVFDSLLRRYGVSGHELGGRIRSVRILGIRSASSNCNNIVMELGQEPGNADGARSLPTTVFVKLPSENFATRVFCNMLRIWKLECCFYRSLAPRVPIRVPESYAVANHGSHFVLLLENLHAIDGVRLHTNRDIVGTPDLDRTQHCLSTLAELHAAFEGTPRDERERLLPADLHPFASPRSRALNRVINLGAIGPCRRAAPETFGEADTRLFRRAFDHWDALSEWWYREPQTLIHGDSHVGNFFWEGERMGMLDFQAAHWSKGMRDVQYLLINTLPEPLLSENEANLIQHYCDELARFGVALPLESAFEQYRAFSFQTLMTEVVSLGLGTLTESDEIIRTLLGRSVAAVRRLDFEGWLDALIRGRSG